jgi:biopolymer transport protein ExbB
MNPQFGLANVWAQGDIVTRSVAVLLLLMSLASWMVILIKMLDLLRYRKIASKAEDFWRSPDLANGLNSLGQADDNPFRQLVEQGRDASAHHQQAQGQLSNTLDPSDWITRSLRHEIDEFTSHLQSGMAVLASVGSTAPFVGLFGTVWGIYHALLSIGMAGQATIDQVAGPVGESLIMTAMGLAVAIPAVLGYNALVRGNKRLLHKLGRFAHDLHAYFLTGARVHPVSPGSPARKPELTDAPAPKHA